MDDLVHSKDKLLQFTEKVTGEDGQVIGYLCANIEEQNLRYDYLEDPSNQELGQIELIEDGGSLQPESSPGWAINFR